MHGLQRKGHTYLNLSELSGEFMIQSLLLCCSNSFPGLLFNQSVSRRRRSWDKREKQPCILATTDRSMVIVGMAVMGWCWTTRLVLNDSMILSYSSHHNTLLAVLRSRLPRIVQKQSKVFNKTNNLSNEESVLHTGLQVDASLLTFLQICGTNGGPSTRGANWDVLGCYLIALDLVVELELTFSASFWAWLLAVCLWSHNQTILCGAEFSLSGSLSGCAMKS